MPLTFELDKGMGVFSAEGDVVFDEGLKVLLAGLNKLNEESVRLVMIDIRRSKETEVMMRFEA